MTPEEAKKWADKGTIERNESYLRGHGITKKSIGLEKLSIPMNEFLTGKISKDKYIVENIIPEKSIIGIFGLSGSLKSIFIQYICSCIATGKKVLGKYKVKKSPVYNLSSEVKSDLDRKRYIAIFRGMNINPRRRSYENLQLNYLDRSKVSLLSDRTFYDELKEDLISHRTKVLVIDTLSPLIMDYDDNKSSAIVEVFKTKLFPLVDELGLSIIFIMHSQKTGKDFLGSIKIKASADLFYEVLRDDVTNEIQLLSHKDREGEHNIKLKVDFESKPDNKTYKISFNHLDSYYGKQSVTSKGIDVSKISIAKETILNKLSEKELIYTDLVNLHKIIGVGEKTIKRAIKELYETHQIKKLKGKERGYTLS
jgi:RecA-family ATPase